MPKKPNEILTSLQLADAYLQQVRQQLIRCDSLADQTEPTLLRVAGLLESLHNKRWTEIDKQAVRTLLASVRANAARAQLLLDTAASFHCGAALTGPAVPDTYTSDGSWETSYPSDQICLNA